MSQAKNYEMKASGVEWIGMMPSDWQIQKAKYFLTVTNGSDPVTEGEIPVYGSGSKSFRTCGEYKEGPAVLVGRKGSIDKPRYVTGRYWNVDTAFDVKTKGFDLKLYYYLATCFDYQFYMSQTTLPSMTQTNYRNMFLPVPPLPEQTVIAAYLDEKCATIDAIIAEAKATIEEYKAWRASVIFEAVTKGLDPNAEMKDSGVEWIGEIPRGWAVERLKAMFSFGKGLPITKEDLVEQGIPVISYGQIHAKFNTGVEVLPQLLRYVDAKWLVSNANSLVSEGDFIFADTSEDMEGCGNCVYVDTLNEGAQLFAGYHTIIFKPKRSKHNKFLAYLFKSDAWRTQLRSRVGGVKLFSISRRMLNLATVILPPQNEQTAIAAYLDSKCAAIDGIILEKEDLISDLETYKRSLIFEIVTGKRRVC